MASVSLGGLTSRSQVRSRGFLDQFCEENGLAAGQYAHTAYGGDYLRYFRVHGFSEAAFFWLFFHDEGFRSQFGDLSEKQARKQYAQRHGLTEVFRPRYVHAYERIARQYPSFGFTVDMVRRLVVFRGYPLCGGRLPTLYDLVRGVVTPDPPVAAKKSNGRCRAYRRRYRGASFVKTIH
ncbi:MAG: hypothetical protein U1C49_00270 [Candidatus Andersenbacteria bacterium]|nr:hypothetical protein [bacterium]MDZ4225259.1 hypothetical protein [Candidatus Andersenbacteria bacterium]